MAKKSFSTSISCSKYSKFVENLTDVQRAAVRSCGFGSLLDFDCTEAPRAIAYMLAQRFHVPTRTVRMDNGSRFELNAFVTHQILGVPLGGWKVRNHASSSDKAIIAADTETEKIAPTTEHLFALVTPELTGDKFVRLFMLISLSALLCPTSYARPRKKYYSAVATVTDIPKYDWSSFILDWLVGGIDEFQKSVSEEKNRSTLCGCIIVLLFAYFEYIKAPDIILREDWPRIKIWNDRMINDYLELEGNSPDDTFGHLELKDPTETPFVSTSVASSSFARLPAHVESFIQNLAPHNELNPTAHSDQSNVRSQIRDFCRNFHKDIMAASLSAIQPVVSRQMCSMAEMLWNNHGGAATFGPARGSDNDLGTSDAATPVQVDRVVPEVVSSHTRRRQTDTTPVQMDMEAPQGRTTRSRSKAMNTPTYVDMSSATSKGKKQLHKGMSSATRMTPITANNTSKGTKSRSESEQVPDSYEIPVQTTRDTRSNTKKDFQSNKEATEKGMDKEEHTGKDKTTGRGDNSVGQPSVSEPENVNDDVDTGLNKNLTGGYNTAVQPSLSTEKDVNNTVALGIDNVIAHEQVDDISSGSSQGKKQLHEGMPSGTSKSISRGMMSTIEARNNSSEAAEVHDSYEIPGQTTRKTISNTENELQSNLGGADKDKYKTVDIVQDEPTSGREKHNANPSVCLPKHAIDDVDAGFGKTVCRVGHPAVHVSVSTPNGVNDVEQDVHNVIVDKQGGQHGTDTECKTIYSDYTPVGTINCAQPFSYTTPNSESVPSSDRQLSLFVYRSHINSDVNWKNQSGSSVHRPVITSNFLREVVPDSFEGQKAPPKTRKREIGAISNLGKVIDVGSGSDSSKANKKKRLNEKELDYSNKLSASKDQVDDVTPEIDPPSVQSISDAAARKSSEQFVRKRAQKPSVHLGTQDLFYNNPQKKIELAPSQVKLYELATRRSSKQNQAQSNIIAEIGRFFITQDDFQASFKPKGWVSNFAMNMLGQQLCNEYVL